MLETMSIIYLKERCYPILSYHLGFGKKIKEDNMFDESFSVFQVTQC